MYNTTEAYKSAAHAPIQHWKIRGTVNNRTIPPECFVQGSVEVTCQASESTDVTLGGRFISELEMSLMGQPDFIPGSYLPLGYGQWQGAVINLEVGLDVTHEEGFEWIPLTPFTVTEAEWSANGVHLKAVDNMAKFDKPATFSTTSGTLYQLASFLCSKSGVQFGMSNYECSLLPNGNRTLGLDPNGQGSLKTYRDILSWLAQAVGCFATIDRYGKLVFRRFTGDTIDINNTQGWERYVGGSWSDYTTHYTGISVTNIEGQTTSYYHVDPDNGATMNLGANPFLQLGLEEVVEAMREDVLTEVEQIQFTPFDVTLPPDPSIDLGDHIKFAHIKGMTGGERPIGVIMAYTWRFNSGIELEGFGKNPSLASAQSKNDKVISGILGDMNRTVIRYFAYENADQIDLGSTEVQAALIAFGNSSETDVDIWHEFKLNADVTGSTMQVYAYYYLDDVLQDYQPIDTISEDGYHILNLNYHISNLPANSLHSWKVRLKTVGGTAEIAEGDAHVVLSGVNLGAGSEWDGVIRADDQIPAYNINGIGIVTPTDGVVISLGVPLPVTLSDQIAAVNLNGIGITDITVEGHIEIISPPWFQFCGDGLYTGESIGTALI